VTAIERIVDDLERALAGEPWHGPSIFDIVRDLHPAAAAAHPVPGAHSIWELLHHVTAWTRAVHARVEGRVSEPAGEADWPPVRTVDAASWLAALDDLRRAQAELVAGLRKRRDDDLTLVTPNREYDLGHMLRGLVQHHTYHAGQMALLRNAQRARGAQ
jgi:uncharacterized damage-inducible protein DinB